MQTFRAFRTRQEARDYRYEHGTGGWIFSADDDSTHILFPPDMTPTIIMLHPLTHGKSGAILANA